METFRDRVAVITGAASGIGRGLARRCAHEGMNVVLADIESIALEEAEAELRALNATVVSVVTDVAKVRDVEILAQKTLEAFGAIHLLCNNAGVGVIRSVWESTLVQVGLNRPMVFQSSDRLIPAIDNHWSICAHVY